MVGVVGVAAGGVDCVARGGEVGGFVVVVTGGDGALGRVVGVEARLAVGVGGVTRRPHRLGQPAPMGSVAMDAEPAARVPRVSRRCMPLLCEVVVVTVALLGGVVERPVFSVGMVGRLALLVEVVDGRVAVVFL